MIHQTSSQTLETAEHLSTAGMAGADGALQMNKLVCIIATPTQPEPLYSILHSKAKRPSYRCRHRAKEALVQELESQFVKSSADRLHPACLLNDLQHQPPAQSAARSSVKPAAPWHTRHLTRVTP